MVGCMWVIVILYLVFGLGSQLSLAVGSSEWVQIAIRLLQ